MPISFKDLIAVNYTKDEIDYLAKRARDRKNGRIDEEAGKENEEGSPELTKKYKKETPGQSVQEKTLTPAEKKKREEIAKAIEKDQPDMPMDKKMAIATATAKKVAEACWKDYKQVGMKEKDGKKVPNCVPEEAETEVDEALTLSQRMKAKQTFRKNKSKIAMGKKRAERRKASPEKLKQRALKQARKAVEKLILKNKTKDDLSYSQRQSLEKQVDKKKSVVQRISKKILPQVRKAEQERLQNKNKSNKD